MTKIHIILGSTRPYRNGEQVARWVYEMARRRSDVEIELVDVADYNLPLLDEPMPPSLGQYTKGHTKAWSRTIAAADGYIFVTAEYNHGVPAALKNAIDYLYREWNDKAAGFVSYGSAGGVRAVEHLRGIMAEVQIADVRESVSFSLLTDFANYRALQPKAYHEQALERTLDQVVRWARALASVRETVVAAD